MLTLTHIKHYNRLNGKIVSKKALRKFHAKLKADIDGGRVTPSMQYGPELIKIEKVLVKGIKEVNGHTMPVQLTPIVIKPVAKKLGKSDEVRKPKPTPDPAKQKRQDIPTKRKEILDQKSKAGVTFKDLKGPQSTVDSRPLTKPAAPITPKVKLKPAKDFSSLGFTSAAKAPNTVKGLFRLPGAIGEFLGEMQRYKGQIILAGEFSSGKSELAKQIANGFAQLGDEVAFIDWEQGGLESRDTISSIERNIDSRNRAHVHFSESVEKEIDAVKKIGKEFPVVVIDSGTQIEEVSNKWLDQLRVDHPKTFWIVLMQLLDNGKVRGGSSASFNAPTVINTYAPDKGPDGWRYNYAEIMKNRGNKRGVFYSISKKKIIKPQES